MAFILIKHRVEDFDKWMGALNERARPRLAPGALGAQLMRNADDPNEVVVLFKWDTLENARWFAKSGALPEAMQLPGDSGPTEIYFLDEVD
ncbi:MAG: antibiotic biosynthesis monooxygenase family protein [Chloroflexia bacterium]